MIDEDRRRLLFRNCQTRQELHDWVYLFLDLDLPGTIVDPDSNTTPLDMVWDVYSHFLLGSDVPRRLYYSARDAGKTLSESVSEVLLLLHLNLNTVHLAAIKEQSINAQKYLKKFLMRPDFRDFVAGSNNEDETEVIAYRSRLNDLVLTEKEALALSNVDDYERISSKVEIVVATMQSVNGKHASYLALDEIDVMQNPVVYQEAANIPTVVRRNGRAILPLTVLTSTRKTAFGLVQEEIDRAKETGLAISHWNIFDVTERCPPERHRPDLPLIPIYRSKESLRAVDEKKYGAMPVREQQTFLKDEGFAGCLTNCKMFASCKGNLAIRQDGDSEFLKPVVHVQNQFQINSRNSGAMAKAQLLCWEPASTGLIYPTIEELRHVISPARAYEKIYGELPPANLGGLQMTKASLCDVLLDLDLDWWAGADYGDTHPYAFVYGFKFGRKAFVMDALGGSQMGLALQVRTSEPAKRFAPKVWGDMAAPASVTHFRANGFRMQEWKKGPGSVGAGITIVGGMLTPVMEGDPDLFFIRDVDDDPHIDFLVKQLKLYHYKLDAAGRPTDEPAKVDDDFADALRYGVMNAFPILHNRVGVEVVEEQISAPAQGARYDEKNWVKQAISEHTGKAWDGPASWGEAFKNPDGTPFFGGEKKGPKQQRGRLIVDVD